MTIRAESYRINPVKILSQNQAIAPHHLHNSDRPPSSPQSRGDRPIIS
ncbi:hypothetical protein NWP22_02425 [Anabaenopsis tanganyikae CS-531]|uniref:Uncharacterized protein n=2 Tax=Anabaenopsis TaxID=110103 RepID=A0ABT5ARD5_9CYAN|nr:MULTISPECIES: hypothetical protein [Anabaenopsis]MDB9539846.1 hypothetical protein [Anabaenopsis arnoldii]MDH6092151.1 hypothetical protein [Anabaenopsis arnoldii]MDH6104741.1 hypothetical protein [Anabaenopsis tanganyikae CS-531]